jgi:hypothetical protein
LAFIPVDGYAECAPNATPEQIDAARLSTLDDPDVVSSVTEGGYLKITIVKPNGSMVLSYFTLPEHPAHPANVITAIYEAEGAIHMLSRGFTAGNCQVFESWMKGFEAQHEQLRQSFKSNDS